MRSAHTHQEEGHGVVAETTFHHAHLNSPRGRTGPRFTLPGKTCTGEHIGAGAEALSRGDPLSGPSYQWVWIPLHVWSELSKAHFACAAGKKKTLTAPRLSAQRPIIGPP